MGKKAYTPREEYTDTVVPEMRDAEQVAGREDDEAVLSSFVGVHQSLLTDSDWNESEDEVFERLEKYRPPVRAVRAWLMYLLGLGGHLRGVKKLAGGPVERRPLARYLFLYDPEAKNVGSEPWKLIAMTRNNAAAVLAEIEAHQIRNARES